MAPNHLGFLNVPVCSDYNLDFDVAGEREMFGDFWILGLRLGNSLTPFLTDEIVAISPRKIKATRARENGRITFSGAAPKALLSLLNGWLVFIAVCAGAPSTRLMDEN